MNACRSLVLTASLVAACPLVTALAAQDSLRIVMTTGTVCHALPDGGSAAAERYHVGDLLPATRSTQGPGRRVWYFDAWRVKGISPACWVPADSTAPFDLRSPESAYSVVVEHVLARRDASFDDDVEVLNLLEQGGARDSIPPVRQSGLIRFKALRLVDRAVSRITSYGIADKPLMRAWIHAHRDVLWYFEPGAVWIVPADVYWRIVDENRAAAWADEAAWIAAQHLPPADECYAPCHLAMVRGGPEQYWRRFPNGSAIAQALELAARLASDAVATASIEAPSLRVIDSVRAGLSTVRAPQKERLDALLNQLARTATRSPRPPTRNPHPYVH